MSEIKKRHHNFDCSQLISFRALDLDKEKILGLDLFEAIGFNVLVGNDIKEVKKEYFRSYEGEFFIELEDKDFIGEIEEWENFENPPERVINFAKNILLFKEMNKLVFFKVFVSVFAELGRTSNCIIDISPEELMKTLYFMSRNNFDVWVDNLTIRFID